MLWPRCVVDAMHYRCISRYCLPARSRDLGKVGAPPPTAFRGARPQIVALISLPSRVFQIRDIYPLLRAWETRPLFTRGGGAIRGGAEIRGREEANRTHEIKVRGRGYCLDRLVDQGVSRAGGCMQCSSG